jgi:hypothetical protein
MPILSIGWEAGSKPAGELLEAARSVALVGAASVFFGQDVFQAADMRWFHPQARSVPDNTDLPELRECTSENQS